MKITKKNRYMVKVFGIQGRAVNDVDLQWIVTEISGHHAIQSVKAQLQWSRKLTDFEIAQYSFSADYLESA